jgi:branched-chain amino acid transport system substrate-binding protein
VGACSVDGDATLDVVAGDSTATTVTDDGQAFAIDVSNCEDPDAATAPIVGAVKIGNTHPQSGGPAVLFAPFGDGMRAYIDYYNSVSDGINGVPIELISKDDQYAPDITKAAVDELIFDDGVHVIAGMVGLANGAAVRAELNALCIPQMWSASGSTMWGNIEEYPWSSGLLVPFVIEVDTFLEYAAARHPAGGTLGLFYVTSEGGMVYRDAVHARAAHYGFEIIAEETVDAADSGAPIRQMTSLVAANPDVIASFPLGTGCIAFMNELGNARSMNPGFDPMVYLTGTCASAVTYNAVTNGGNDGVLTATMFKDVADSELQRTDADIAAYLEEFAATGSAGDPAGIAASGWVAAEATVKTIEAAAATGTLSRESIANAVRNVDFRPSLVRDGLDFRMNATDGYAAEGVQLVSWSAADAGFVDVGEARNFDGLLGINAD